MLFTVVMLLLLQYNLVNEFERLSKLVILLLVQYNSRNELGMSFSEKKLQFL